MNSFFAFFRNPLISLKANIFINGKKIQNDKQDNTT